MFKSQVKHEDIMQFTILSIVREVDLWPQLVHSASEVDNCNSTPGGCFSANMNDESRRIHLQFLHQLKLIHCKFPEADFTGLDLKPELTEVS